jgi:hypothetical protein
MGGHFTPDFSRANTHVIASVYVLSLDFVLRRRFASQLGPLTSIYNASPQTARQQGCACGGLGKADRQPSLGRGLLRCLAAPAHPLEAAIHAI